MKTKVEALKDNRVEISVTIEAGQVDSRIRDTYRDFARKYRFPGFRPGRAPRPVIDNALGENAVAATVTEALISETYPLAVDENNLFPAGEPVLSDRDALVEEGKDFTYTLTVEVTPELKLSDYSPVSIELPSEEVTEAEIDTQIERLREFYFEFKDAPANTKVKDGSFVEITTSAKDAQGEEVSFFAAEKRLYEVGSGLFPKAFDKEIEGMKKGDERTFKIDLSGDESLIASTMDKDFGELEMTVKVDTLKKKVSPELTDEWVSETLGIDSLEALRKTFAERLVEEKANYIPHLKEQRCLVALQERLEGEVPASLAEEAEVELLQGFFNQLQAQGSTLDRYLAQQNLTPEQFKEDIKRQANDVAAQDLALDAWARHAKIEVTDADLTHEFELYAEGDAKKVEKEWRETGRLHLLRRSIARTRAVEQVMESAKVTVAEPGAEAKAEAKPAKKAAAKKPAAKKDEAEAKPAKKAAPKKAAAKKSEGEDASK